MPKIPDDTESRLLEAAGEVFAEEGYKAATVRKILERAGIGNTAAINYYFGDKENLYAEAVKKAFRGRSGKEGPPSWPAGTPADVKLREFVRGFAANLLGSSDGPGWHTQLRARELTQPGAGCAAFVRDFARPQCDALCGLLREVMPAGTSPEKVRLTAMSIIGQVIYHHCARPVIAQLVSPEEFASYDAARLADHIADFSLAALGLSARKRKHESDKGSL